MAISRAQLVKELEPGLNALFGLEYDGYENEHAEIYDIETSDRAFEEEVMLSGFGEAPVKNEGAGVAYDQAQEVYTARYTHDTIALAFSLAGVVAAVRFRFSLSQPSDAMYIFVSIGIGLGAGIGALGVAAVISLTFVLATLCIWKLEYGKTLSGPFLTMMTRRSGGEDDY